jgi:ribonuclease P protein component
MSRYTFSKKEALCSKLVIDKLFKAGKSFKAYPLRVVYLPLTESDSAAKLLITVPKKRFGNAVSRNRIKRLIREAYRLNKPDLIQNWQTNGKYFALAFVYIGNDIPNYHDLCSKVTGILDKLKEETI